MAASGGGKKEAISEIPARISAEGLGGENIK
jgi:hypothetical protein